MPQVKQLLGGELGIPECLPPKPVPFPPGLGSWEGGGRARAGGRGDAAAAAAAALWGLQDEPRWEVGGAVSAGITSPLFPMAIRNDQALAQTRTTQRKADKGVRTAHVRSRLLGGRPRLKATVGGGGGTGEDRAEKSVP